MEKHPKPGYLFFTPRAPNGKRLSHLRFRHHLRASEDAQPDPRSKEMQGLGGQMAPNNAKGWSGPDRDDQGAKVWNVPRFDDRGFPCPPGQAGASLSKTRPGQGRYDLPKEPQDNWNGEGNGRFVGSAEAELAKGEKPGLGIEAGINTNKNFKAPSAADDPVYDTRKEYQEEHAKQQEDDARQSFTFPPCQRRQNPQPASPSSVPIKADFTPRSSSKPLPASTLKPSREWLNKSGEPPDTLQHSPFVVPSRPFVQRPR